MLPPFFATHSRVVWVRVLLFAARFSLTGPLDCGFAPRGLSAPTPHVVVAATRKSAAVGAVGSLRDPRREVELEPFDKLARFIPLSTNPPNPKGSFRLGDWMFASMANTVYYSSAQPNHHLFDSAPPPAPPPRQQQPAVSHGPPPPPKPTHPILTPSGRAFAVGGKVQNVSSDPLSPCIMYWPDNEPLPEQGQIRPSNVVGVTYLANLILCQQPPILNTGNRGPISHQPGDWICQKCNYLNWRRRKCAFRRSLLETVSDAEGNGDSISAAVQAERIALLTQVLSQTHLAASNAPAPTTTTNKGLRSHSLTPPQVRRTAGTLNTDSYSGQSVAMGGGGDSGKTLYRSMSHLNLGNHPTGTGTHSATTPVQGFSSSPIYQTSGHHGQQQQQRNAFLHPVDGYGRQQQQQREREPSPLLYATGPGPASTGRGGLRAYSPLPPPRVAGFGNASTTGFNHGFGNADASLHAPAPLLPSFLVQTPPAPTRGGRTSVSSGSCVSEDSASSGGSGTTVSSSTDLSLSSFEGGGGAIPNATSKKPLGHASWTDLGPFGVKVDAGGYSDYEEMCYADGFVPGLQSVGGVGYVRPRMGSGSTDSSSVGSSSVASASTGGSSVASFGSIGDEYTAAKKTAPKNPSIWRMDGEELGSRGFTGAAGAIGSGKPGIVRESSREFVGGAAAGLPASA
ncbi:hypothetical protein FA15DRAFT_696918 [Coprinopsis marcescibilis]|uniref:RanBP2-type domain-containing protein n=1 Tax=Coprinopsis marcescibilis TaxID=230819 RepID=A0A5C3KKK3_COPMA|nr:hypothetical protein FA15DRAFT_696918 [Coprinopsis marcescibilis]